eukprot:1169999-Amphidinium_carterae.2
MGLECLQRAVTMCQTLLAHIKECSEPVAAEHLLLPENDPQVEEFLATTVMKAAQQCLPLSQTNLHPRAPNLELHFRSNTVCSCARIFAVATGPEVLATEEIVPYAEQHVVIASDSDAELVPVDEEGAQADSAEVAETYSVDVAACEYLVSGTVRKKITLSALCSMLCTDRKSLTEKLRALGEASWKAQQEVVAKLVQYVDRMSDAGVEGVAFIERMSYDATPCELPVAYAGEGMSKVRAKLFAVERTWAMVISAGMESFTLRGTLSNAARVSDRETAENIRNVLLDVEFLPANVDNVFKKVIRIAETDELAANCKAERILVETRSAQWRDGTLHAICMAHKAHSSAEKTWEFMSHTISGAIHCYKALQDGTIMHRLRKAMREEIPLRLQVYYQGSPPQASKKMRERLLEMCLPPPTAPKRRVHAQRTLALLNGNWLRKSVLEHYCKPGCCRDIQETRTKLVNNLPKALLSQKATMLNRSNWTEWHTQMNLFGLLSGPHCFGQELLARILTQGPAAADIPLEDVEPIVGNTHAEAATAANTLLHTEEELPPQDLYQLERKENARSARIAAEWLSGNMLEDLYILRSALVPEVHLMSALLQATSVEVEVNKIIQREGAQEDDLRVLQLQEGGVLHMMTRACRLQLSDSQPWAWLLGTEGRHSKVFKTASRSPAVVYHHCIFRHELFPWHLFKILDPKVDKREIVQTKRCLLDPFSKKFLDDFCIDGELTQHGVHVLQVMADMLVLNTFSTERVHSSTSQRLKHRHHARRMSLPDVAVMHMGLAAPPWIRQWLAKSASDEQNKKIGLPNRKRGPKPKEGSRRKCKRESDRAACPPSTAPAAKRPRGGGGAWRAFQHVHMAGKRLDAESIKDLCAKYHQLSESEREYYVELGKKGSLQKKPIRPIQPNMLSL